MAVEYSRQRDTVRSAPVLRLHPRESVSTTLRWRHQRFGSPPGRTSNFTPRIYREVSSLPLGLLGDNDRRPCRDRSRKADQGIQARKEDRADYIDEPAWNDLSESLGLRRTTADPSP